MPRVHKPSSAQAQERAREYALLLQMKPQEDGSVDQKMFEHLTKLYASKPASSSDLSFEEFVALFQRPSTKAESGEGNCIGYAAQHESEPLKTWRFQRRDVKPDDVRIQITHAGICHSDIHQVKNEWHNSTYPMVPGHEIAGIVTEVGSQVTKFKVGDRVGVGCMVNSCQSCDACKVMKEEQFCPGCVYTYNGKEKDGSPTYGGYSTHVLVNEKFVLNIPDGMDLKDAAPLLCAGITVYSPIKNYGFDKPGLNIGVVGLGGLGHMAVKVLKALGVTVTVISTSPNKKDEATKVLGADHFMVSKDEEQMKAAASSLDGIINTVSSPHDAGALMGLLKVDSTMVMVGLPAADQPLTLPNVPMIFGRKRIGGSPIGGIKQTQEMLDFCAEKGVVCMTEQISADYINKAYERVLKSDVRYRFVVDIQGSLIN